MAAGHAFKALKLSPTRHTHAPLLLLLLALAAANSAAAATGTVHSPPAPSPTVLSSSNASHDNSGNPDYYTFDLGTTLSGAAASGDKVYVICMSTWAPFIFYNRTTNTVRGYEWDLFLAVSKAMGLSFDARVMGWAEMMNSLALDRSDPGHCDIAPSSIPVRADLLPMTGLRKVQFSVPTYHSGYGISTAVTWAEYDMWSFGRVFTAQLWAMLMGTAAVLALLTYAAEHDYAKRGLGNTKYPTAFRAGMYEAVYNCVGKLFNVVQDLKVTSLSGKLISMGWGFLVLVASTTYTAGVTATLTSANFKTTISGVTDLPHYRVVSDTPVGHKFWKFGFMATGMPFSTDAEGDAMLDAVARGAADALVVDYPWLQYKLASRCDVALVGQPFNYIDNAVGFNPNIPKSFVDEYNFHLMTLKQDGTYEEYQDKYFRASQCLSLDAPQLVATFQQLKGLWVILGSIVGLAIILLILPRISSRFDADVKRMRSSSVLDVKKIGKSIGKSILKLGKGGVGPDPGLPKEEELQNNPSTGQDVGAKVVGSSLHLDEPSAGQLPGPYEAPEPPQAAAALAPKAQYDDPVVPFVSDDGPAGEACSGANLEVFVILRASEATVVMDTPGASVEPPAYDYPTHMPVRPRLIPRPSTALLHVAHPDS